MKRIYIYFLIILAFAFAYTKGTIFTIFLYFIPFFAQILLISLAIIFFSFLYWLTLHEDEEQNSVAWQSILKVTVFGTICGYLLQLINIAVYLKNRNIPVEIGLFEDEFYRSVVFLLPLLLFSELIYRLVKKSIWLNLGLSFLILAACFLQIRNLSAVDAPKSYPAIAKSSPDKPNVIVILADDLGTGDLSFNGQKKYTTPNIDKLAAEGVNFRNAYSSAPICSPSRAGLLTGKYQQRFGFEHLTDGFSTHPFARQADFSRYGHQFGGDDVFWWNFEVNNRGIDPKTTTLAEFLKEEGYATGVVGKWHLGNLPKFQPSYHGFDYSFGTNSAGMFYLTPGDERISEYFHTDNFFEKLEHQLMVYQLFENGNPYKIEKEEYTTDLFTRKGLEFIEQNKENRFFLYLPYTAVHGPFQAPKRIYDQLTNIEKHEDRVYAAMVISLDEAVGLILKKLEALDLDENTIVVFASDNGAPLYFPAGTNSPLSGGKMSSFEGGIRVPFIIHRKNHLKPQDFQKSVSLMDIFKTVAATIGKEVPKDIAQDGVNLLPFVANDTIETPHKSLFWRIGYVKMLREDDWKLSVNEKEGLIFLHNLKDDPSELKNLADENPDKVKELKQELAEWEKQLQPTNWRFSLDAKIEDGHGNRYYFPW